MVDKKTTPEKIPPQKQLYQVLMVFCACVAATLALVYLSGVFAQWAPWNTLLPVFLFSGLLTGCVLRLLNPTDEPFRQAEALRDHLQKMVDDRTLELEDALRKAEAANLAKCEFLAVMSHELRTPLTAILGFSEILLRRPKGKTPEKTKEYLEHIHSSGHKLLTLIDDILDLSEIRGERDGLFITRIDLKDLFTRVSSPFTRILQKKDIRLVTRIESDLRTANTDGQKLKKIMGNLLSNAIKFSSNGSEITMSARLADEGKSLEISVADHGIGIQEEHLEKIFEPFSQGVGLGLARSRQLAERLGGRISVESIPGKGSTFVATVPFLDPTAESAKTQAPQPPRHFRGRILVAEDNLANLKLVQAMLETLGCRVDTARNGREAVEACSLNDYDLILMDCQMPGLDGYEASREIRARKRAEQGRAHTPVVALTAHVLDGDKESCVEAEMDDFLGKPFDQYQLVKVLGRWLPPEKHGTEAEEVSEIPDEESGSFSEILSIDTKFLDRIRVIQSRGNPSLLENVIDLYLRETPELLKLLRNASDRGDAKGLQQVAHTLKSSSANLGATRLARICEEVEALARSKETAKARPLVARLEIEYPIVQTALKAER